MIYCIGLTGDIASGKSTVADMFANLGVTVLSADKVSKELTQKDTPAYKAIVTHFGAEVLSANGELNRRHLREIIFSNPQEKIWLEELLHPLIRTHLEYNIQLCTSSYCLIEIP